MFNSRSSSVSFYNRQEITCTSFSFILIPLSFLPSLSSSGCGAAHPDRPPPLQWRAGAGHCHCGVSGQRGLPLSLEPGLEGGGQQQLLRGVSQPGGPGDGRPLQLEQHHEPPCSAVEEGGLSELWGQSEWTEPCHSNPGPWQLLGVERRPDGVIVLYCGSVWFTCVLLQLCMSSCLFFNSLWQSNAVLCYFWNKNKYFMFSCHLFFTFLFLLY